MTNVFSSGNALVLGGGVIGLFSALALHRAGYRVRLLERDLIGRQASWAGGGILSPLCPWRAPKPVWQLTVDSLRVYPELCRELSEATGIDPEWTPSGMAVFDQDQQAEALAWARRVGVVLEPRQIEQGGLGRVPALWLPWVAQLRNPRLCRALHRFLEQAGVSCQPQRGELRLIADGRRAAVLDAQGDRLDADLVVVAAGAWSAGLLQAVAWELPIRPVKGQMILLRAVPGLLTTIVQKDGHYLIPRRDGRILVGSTVEPEAGFDLRTDPAAGARLLEVARRLLPPDQPLEVERQWAGLRPGSPDECPIIDRHPVLENLFVSAGHYRNGLTLAPASAARLVDRVLNCDQRP